MKKLIIYSCVIFLYGCVSTEYIKQLRPEDLLYSETVTIDKTQDKEIIAINLGRDKTNFIEPDRSAERLQFENSYPISIPSTDDYENLKGYRFRHRVGQVLRLSADLDKRTSGFLKDERGASLSVSGMVNVSADHAISSSIAIGSSQVAAGSVSSNSTINPAQSTGYNAGVGLGVGLLVGVIDMQRSEAAKEAIINCNDFGSRMSESTTANSMPTAYLFPNNGWGPVRHIVITEGVVKAIYFVDGGTTIDYKKRIFLLSTVGSFRGEAYKEKYPETEGWEFRITNINTIAINDNKEPEKKFWNIKKILLDMNISL